MRLVVLDENDKVKAEYHHDKVRELLVKYFKVLGDVGKSFDQLSEDLLDRAK